jgi:hypothetical protein
MNKLLTAVFAATLASGMNASIAQNVKSDQDKAQGQEQKMQEKEKGATGGAAAKDCASMTGRAKEQCLKKNPPATGQTDSGTTQQNKKQ